MAANAKRPQTRKLSKRSTPKKISRKTKGIDAIALLKADHREVEKLFDQFEKAKAADRKRAIVGRVL